MVPTPRISVIISMGDTEAAAIFDSIGQGSFGAALDSSINIGCAIFDTTKDEFISDIGPLPLNCLVFQDNIARMNSTFTTSEERSGDNWQDPGQETAEIQHLQK